MSLETVGVLITSEEILRNKKCDCASNYLIQELNSLHYTVRKVTVIEDKESSIINELDSLIKNCDIVIVVSERCSAIYRAIAGMISQELRQNQDLIGYFTEIGEPYDKGEIFLPIQAKIIHNSNVYPVVHFQRVFILKEKYVKQSFNKILKQHLLHYKKPRKFQKTIQINQNGNSLLDLKELNKISNSCVKVDCSKNDQFFTFKVSSQHLSDMAGFIQEVEQKFDSYRLKFLDESEVWESVYSSSEEHVQQSLKSIEKCLEQYILDDVFLCFNGGKDCTVLLHLVLTVIKKRYPQYTQPIFCLYVQSEKPFPEQEEFINQMKSYYNLKILTIRSGIKDALQKTLEKYPNYKACFMGTRRTDPYSSDLKNFQMTDSNWPQIMRVSPLLDWHYSDIWDYLLYYKVPYCKLYDMGFTSLGNTINTTKNPSLVYYDQFEGKEMYLPAYKLLKEIKERNGRNSS